MVPAEFDSVERAIIELARPEGPVDLESILTAREGPEAGRVDAAVQRHRLVGPLVDVLERSGREVPEHLADVVDDDRLTRLRANAVLAKVAPVLDGSELPWVVLKGPVIASLMNRPELRTYNDLDLLVAADDFGAVLECLGRVGVQEINRNWQPYIDHLIGEVPLVAMGVTVDLHWHVVGLAHVRSTMRVDPAAMLTRRRRLRIGDLDAPVLDPDDRLLHIALHTALAGATRLTQLRDLAVVAAQPVDWDEVAARARAAGIARLVAHPLDRTRLLFPGSVPDEVCVGLGGRSVALRRRLDGARPSEWRSYVVAPTRDGRRATARALVGRGRERIRRSRSTVAQGWDFTDEAGRLYFDTESGGPDGRDRYLAAIGGAARDEGRR